MGMRIGQSIPGISMTAMSKTSRAIQKSLERLSTGRRINSARDGSASFAFGINVDSQLRGLRQGTLNVNSAQSMLMTADSAIQSQMDLVQRMRELAVQANSGTLSATDRQNLNSELQGLLEEFSRITNSTEFNGAKIINGSTLTTSIQTGANRGQSVDLRINDLSSASVFQKMAGTGSFNRTATIGFGGSGAGNFRRVETGDLNNDGKADIVACNPADGLVVWLGNGAGRFTVAQTLNSLAGGNFDGTRLVDVNADGILDIVNSVPTGIDIFRGKGDGTFMPATTIALSNLAYMDAADIDGNGSQDLVSLDSFGVVYYYKNDGQGSFSLNQTFATSAYSIRLADLDGDRKAEIIVGDANLTAYKLGASGTFSVLSTAPSLGVSQTVRIEAGDLNGDGITDLAFTYDTGLSGGIGILLGNGNGTFRVGTSLTSTDLTSPYGLKIVDMNNDGVQDIYASSANGAVLTYLGNGNGTYQAPNTVASGGTVVAVPFPGTFADFDGDGVLDLIQADRGYDYLHFFKGRGLERTALTDLDLRSQTKAQEALKVLDFAMGSLQKARSTIGAIHNRLDSTASANLLLSDSLSEAKSKSQDVDIAVETSELVRNQILQQAQVAVFAQANIQRSLVLNLLRV